ncbi:hypothetical protein B0H63DRAFT_464638 [Podospora didyma]|uniref:Uncharacterized protein n=1 Tax=Podospora didyma TaxID=330526 RepID=A0AAE0NYJ1_9PEZI|nr:hypothetical protein B0H63DRAFT_464638 [Podospora didyma]
MSRFSSRTLSTLTSPLRAPSAFPSTISARIGTARPAAFVSLSRTYASSSPKSAEEASAQSGGSRGKDTTASEKDSSPTDGVVPDSLSEGGARGRTGGGKPLESSHSPPAQPKIHNQSVPGSHAKLTKEQQAEVDQHNKEFEEKHGKAQPASDDKVDKSFWSGQGDRQENPGN